jgi:hypothetical protein
MFSIRKQIATWFYRQSIKRHSRKRLADLQQRLAVLDKDIQETKHWPGILRQRKILVAQIEKLKSVAG